MNSMKIACLLFACVIATALAQTPAAVSETYLADLTVHIQNGTHQIFGRGTEVRDQPAGKAVVQYLFSEEHYSENVYVLERYDLEEYYTVQREEKCMKTKLTNTTMPLQWAWLKNSATKFVEYVHINGRNASVFELKLGYATVAIALDGDVPLVYWRRTASRNLTVIYEKFDGKTPINAKGRYFDVPRECQNASIPSSAPVSGCVAGSTMIASAKVWTDNKVPYSQSGTYQGYRTDCSGYVSMAWELSKPGLTTRTLGTVSKPVAKAAMKPGDVLLNAAEHVVLFAGWTDSSQTHYISYEETQPGEGTVTRVTPYPYWYETNLFLPYRYNGLC